MQNGQRSRMKRENRPPITVFRVHSEIRAVTEDYRNKYCARPGLYSEHITVMHTSRVSSPRYSASRVSFCLETASLYSSPTRLTRLLPQLIFHCATVFYAPRRHSRLLARQPHSPTTLDSPRARLAASCASLSTLCGDPARYCRRYRRRLATQSLGSYHSRQEEMP
jgi:hypothetical protein